MSIEGVDFSWARPSPQALISAGKTFVCRYIGVGVGGKSATRAELDEYTNSGLSVVLDYEEDGEELLGGWDGGVRVAQRADAAAQALGYPGAPIYFNVDFDASAAQQGTINAALDGIASVIGIGRVGLYAGYWVLSRAFDAGKISYGWQTYAWSGGNVDPRAHLYQYSNGEQIDGGDVDFDRAMQPHFGQTGNALADVGTSNPFEEDPDMLTPDQENKLNAVYGALFGPKSLGAPQLTWENQDGPRAASYGVLDIIIYNQSLIASQTAALNAALAKAQALPAGAVDMAAVTKAAQEGASAALAALTLKAVS